MEKYYILNEIKNLSDKELLKFKEDAVIEFDMPPFCSGDYKAKIYKDKLGLYINKENDFFKGCRDYYVK